MTGWHRVAWLLGRVRTQSVADQLKEFSTDRQSAAVFDIRVGAYPELPTLAPPGLECPGLGRPPVPLGKVQLERGFAPNPWPVDGFAPNPRCPDCGGQTIRERDNTFGPNQYTYKCPRCNKYLPSD